MADRGGKRKLPELESDAGFDDEILNLTDTEAAITAIVNSEHGDRPCKGVLVHQLYAMLSNKTSVDTEILTLRQSRGIKLLQFYLSDAAAVTESLFVMPSSAYRADLTSMLAASPASSSLHGSLTRFIPLAIKHMDKLSILESELLAAPSGMEEKGQDMNRSKPPRLLPPAIHGTRDERDERGAPLDALLSAADIDSIVSAGFLCKRRDVSANTRNVLWFSHPILGSLRKWIDSSRKIILAMVRTTRYKEQSDSEMIKKWKGKSPPISPLGLRFHLYDLEGAGLLYKVQGPKAAVYRLTSLRHDS